MVRKYHKLTLKTNPRHHKEGPHNNNSHRIPENQTKYSNQLSLSFPSKRWLHSKKRHTSLQSKTWNKYRTPTMGTTIKTGWVVTWFLLGYTVRMFECTVRTFWSNVGRFLYVFSSIPRKLYTIFQPIFSPTKASRIASLSFLLWVLTLSQMLSVQLISKLRTDLRR